MCANNRHSAVASVLGGTPIFIFVALFAVVTATPVSSWIPLCALRRGGSRAGRIESAHPDAPACALARVAAVEPLLALTILLLRLRE